MLKNHLRTARTSVMKGIDAIESKMENEFDFDLDIDGDKPFMKARQGCSIRKLPIMA